MVQLGEGFAKALGEQGNSPLGSLLDKAMSQMLDELYKSLREDIIAECRAEIQRSAQIGAHLEAAIKTLGTPIVNVAAPQVTVQAPTVTNLPADVTVNIPKPDAPKVTVEPRKKQRILRDANGMITGSETV